MQLAPIFQIPCKPFIFIAVLPINLQYKLDYGCRWGYLPYRPGENQKLRFLNSHFSTQEMAVHITQRRNECRIQLCRQQSILTSWKCVFLLEDGRLYTLLTNTYPGACASYTETRILMLSVHTHKCVFRQIWVNHVSSCVPRVVGLFLEEYIC